MVKRLLGIVLVGFVLVGSPLLAVEDARDPAAAPLSFLLSSSDPCAQVSPVSAAKTGALPDPGTSVIVCGTCGDVQCDNKRVSASCTTIFGVPGRCWDDGSLCTSSPVTYRCYCE